MAIRFVQVTDIERDTRRVAEVQRIFRGYFGAVYGDYADRIPELLSRQLRAADDDARLSYGATS